jgi:phosphatidylglycerophosphate synthase
MIEKMEDNLELSGGTIADTATAWVQAVTGSRVLAAVLFASTALTPKYAWVAIIAYTYASLADLLDGFVARRLGRQSEGGAAFDIGSDKYLCIVSALYAAASGANITACCFMIARSVFVPALRTIRVDGIGLIPPRRGLGAIETLPIRVATTYLLICTSMGLPVNWQLAGVLYWTAGLTSVATVVYSLARDWPRVVRAFSPSAN